MTVDDIRERYQWLAYTERGTRQMIEMIPDDKWDFRPADGARTLGELVQHLYGAEYATLQGIQRGALDEQEYNQHVGRVISSVAEALELAEATHDFRNEVLHDLTDDQLASTVRMFYGDTTVLQALGFIYDEHWHHRGQLTVYLQMLGLEPPSVYGDA